MFTRFIELIFGLCVALYLLVERFGVAGCVRAMRRADPHLLLAVSGAVVFLLVVLAAQARFRWRKERDRQRKERERAAERQHKAADRAAQQAAANTATSAPADTPSTTTAAPATPTVPAADAPATGPDDNAAGPRFLRRRTMPDLLDGLMPDGAADDDLFQVVADTAPTAAPAAGDADGI